MRQREREREMLVKDEAHVLAASEWCDLLECCCSLMVTKAQWRRSVVNMGGQGQSSQAIKLFHITPYVNSFQTLNNPGS